MLVKNREWGEISSGPKGTKQDLKWVHFDSATRGTHAWMRPKLAISVTGAHSEYATTAFKAAVTAAACWVADSSWFCFTAVIAAPKCWSKSWQNALCKYKKNDKLQNSDWIMQMKFCHPQKAKEVACSDKEKYIECATACEIILNTTQSTAERFYSYHILSKNTKNVRNSSLPSLMESRMEI